MIRCKDPDVKDYCLSAAEMRAWVRIHEEPMPENPHTQSITKFPEQLHMEVGQRATAVHSVCQLGGCSQIPALVERSVRDLIIALSSSTSAGPIAVPEAFGEGRAVHSSADHEINYIKRPKDRRRLSSKPARSPSTAARLIRVRDGPGYLGMDKNRFNIEVRPYLTEIPIGKQGVGFDRLDLDNWLEDYKARNGRPGKRKGENKLWDAKKSRVLSIGKGHGISTRLSEEEEFAKALERAASKKRSAT